MSPLVLSKSLAKVLPDMRLETGCSSVRLRPAVSVAHVCRDTQLNAVTGKVTKRLVDGDLETLSTARRRNISECPTHRLISRRFLMSSQTSKSYCLLISLRLVLAAPSLHA